MVNHPDHYNQQEVECIDIIKHCTFRIGSIIKYIWRADHKGNRKQDFEKALWYLNSMSMEEFDEEARISCTEFWRSGSEEALNLMDTGKGWIINTTQILMALTPEWSPTIKPLVEAVFQSEINKEEA